MTTKYLPESTILAPRDPSITDDNEWPIFRLSDAAICLRHTSDPASLLLASEQNPLTVTGKLKLVPDIDEDEDDADYDDLHSALLRRTKQGTVPIEVQNVRTFSYSDSGELWAAGASGWFTIRPSKAYKPIYDQMIESVNTFYFVADAYKTPRRKGKREHAIALPDYTIQELFEKYAAEEMEAGNGAQEAAQKIYQHREFLLAEMIAGKQDIMWGKNPLYVHLMRKFSKDYARIKERLVSGLALREGTQAAVASAPIPKHARQLSLETASTTSSKRGRGRPRKYPPTDVISIGSSSVASSAVKDTPKEAAAKPAGNVAKPYAKPYAIPQKPTRRQQATSASITATPEVQESQHQAEISTPESDAEPNPRPPKSSLRLKPTSASKGPPKSNKRPPPDEDEVDHPELRSSPAPAGKRKREDPPADARHAPKRRNSKHEVDEGIDMPTSPSSTSDQTPDNDQAVGGASATRLNHVPDPIQQDTWLCALDGCTHKVYSASLPASQKLIREHYKLHAYDDDERVRMVRKLQAPSLPTNRLMEKVKDVARGEGLVGMVGSRVAGSRFPQPIKQEY
ncbi:hypothetical protein LTR37_019596 [Vermiconidia calcicola]|uniref:Uncharacterized protein n=1 Tax=Vermiconidia calcicola TaxID=1690605 RepID=A0ACC3MFH2_9PEZI|nr:hypothetical protein LTR37_019596 [Vermiconidia calcicola]